MRIEYDVGRTGRKSGENSEKTCENQHEGPSSELRVPHNVALSTASTAFEPWQADPSPFESLPSPWPGPHPPTPHLPQPGAQPHAAPGVPASAAATAQAPTSRATKTTGLQVASSCASSLKPSLAAASCASSAWRHPRSRRGAPPTQAPWRPGRPREVRPQGRPKQGDPGLDLLRNSLEIATSAPSSG